MTYSIYTPFSLLPLSHFHLAIPQDTNIPQQLTANDLQRDEILIRKIKRMQAQEAAAEEDSDDEVRVDQSQEIGSSDAEEDHIPHRHKREEMSSAPMAQPTQIVDLGDPSDEEDE
jgi:hypothetical protein